MSKKPEASEQERSAKNIFVTKIAASLSYLVTNRYTLRVGSPTILIYDLVQPLGHAVHQLLQIVPVIHLQILELSNLSPPLIRIVVNISNCFMMDLSGGPLLSRAQ
jgi:hypothetical protein